MKTIYILLTTLVMLCSAKAQKPLIGRWTVAATLPATGGAPALGVAGPLAGLAGNMLLVAGGANFPNGMPWAGGVKQYLADGFVFAQNRKGALTPAGTFQLPYRVAYGASCTTPQGVVYAGGETPDGLTPNVLLLKWSDNAGKPEISYLPRLPMPMANSAMATDGRRIFLAGGETRDAVSDLFLCLDLEDTARGWQQLPALPFRVSHAVLLYHAGEQTCYLAGGRQRNAGDTSTLYAQLYAYSIGAIRWEKRKPLPYSLSAGTALMVGDGLLLLGGDRGETFHRAEALIAAIAREQDPFIKAKLDRQKVMLQSGHPGFSRQLLYYTPATDTWSKAGTLPFAVPVTTTALSWKGKAYLVSGEIKAGVRTPEIQAATIIHSKAGGGKTALQP